MPTTLINTGPIGTTGVKFSAKADDTSALLVRVNSIVGSTITVESSPDNTTWTAMPVGLNVTAGAPGVAITNGQITANGRYLFHINNNYVRVRVSTYVGPGLVDAEEELTVESLREVLRPLDTALTAIGSSQATALPIQAWANRFATVAASTGAILPDLTAMGAGQEIFIRNSGANAVNIYPPVGKRINNGTINAAFSQAAAATFRYVTDSNGDYWLF